MIKDMHLYFKDDYKYYDVIEKGQHSSEFVFLHRGLCLTDALIAFKCLSYQDDCTYIVVASGLKDPFTFEGGDCVVEFFYSSLFKIYGKHMVRIRHEMFH